MFCLHENIKGIFMSAYQLNYSAILSVVLLTTTCANLQAAIIPIGAGSVTDQANPEGYTCTNDYSSWVHNAGVVEPAIAGCDDVVGHIGTPTPLIPHLTGPAAQKHAGTHRWWGVCFILWRDAHW
jgi:hypothetical protein